MKYIYLTLIFIFACIEVDKGNPISKVEYEIETKIVNIKKDINPNLTDTTSFCDTTRLQYLTLAKFKETLGYYESLNTYNITNAYGFRGKYQLSPFLIRKYAKVNPRNFLNSPNIQEMAMNRLCAYYIYYLYKYDYIKYINKEINGVTITLECLMLGVHFSPLYLDQWLKSEGRINNRDANVSIQQYMKKFENKGIATKVTTVVTRVHF